MDEKKRLERELMIKSCREMSNEIGVFVCYEDNIKDEEKK